MKISFENIPSHSPVLMSRHVFFFSPLDVVVPERQFNMELIVNCIRSSENPQTHHQALLVLTSAAKIYPVSAHLILNLLKELRKEIILFYLIFFLATKC